MIDPRELRIGNYVTLHGNAVASPIDFEVEGTSDDGIEVAGHIARLTNIHPIPISPEWLERLGFEMDDDMECGIIWYLKLNDDISIYWNGCIEIEIKTQFVTTRYDIDHIKYIHHLQNLYHALTGKELELKEKK
jgi:hypothetical protein